MPFRLIIKQAKRQHRTKIETYYTGSGARRMWQGLQTITDYKEKPSRELPSDASLTDKLNYFYLRFEASNIEACMRAPAVPDDCVIMLSIADVSKTFNTPAVFRSNWTDLTGFLFEKCSSFNLIVIRFHDFVHTGHLNTQNTFWCFIELLYICGVPGKK